MHAFPLDKRGYDLLHRGSIAFSEMQMNGIRIDLDYAKQAYKDISRQVKEQKRKVHDYKEIKEWKKIYKDKFNLDSGDQLKDVLFNKFGYEAVHFTEKGNESTNKEALIALGLPFTDDLIHYRQLSKTKNTYLKNILKETQDGFLHPFMNLGTARTFRSCVAKGTKILVAKNFIRKPRGTAIEKIKVGDWVYCFDDDLKPVLRKVLWAGKTGHKEVIRVHWQSRGGKGYLDVTPEHKIRGITGEYVQAKDIMKADFREGKSRHCAKRRVLAGVRKGDSLYFSGHTAQGKGLLEHRFIYSHFYGKLKKKDIIHHKNGNHLDHNPTNLKKMSLSSHSSLHAKDTICTEKTRKRNVKAVKKAWKEGRYEKVKENHFSLELSKLQILKSLAQAKGKPTKTQYDYSTIKFYAAKYEIDIEAIQLRYDKHGKYISKNKLIKLSKLGRSKVQKILGHNYYKLLRLYNFYKIPTERQWANQFGEFKPGNHTITKIEWIKKKTDVYDLEVEECHNFIANEICVHNSSNRPNIQNMPIRDPEIGSIVRRCFIPRDDHYLIEEDYGGIEVKGSCVTGDTLIETVEGSKTIRTIISQVKRNKDVYVYGYSKNLGRITVAKVTGGGRTRRNTPVFKVVLDNGRALKVTSDHKFMLRNEEYKKTEELLVNESLMPFYKTVKKAKRTNYHKIYLNNGNTLLAHNLVALDIFNTQIKNSSLVVHHKDGNGLNNSIYNLEIMHRKKHMKIHSIQGWKNNRKKHIKKNWMCCPEKNSKQAKETNEQRKLLWSEKDWEEFGFRVSEGIKRKGGRKAEKNGMYGKKQSLSTKKKIAEKNKGNKYRLGKSGWSRGHTKETHPSLQKISESLKGKKAWNARERIPEATKRKISLSLKGRVFSEETKKKISDNKKEYWKNKEKEQCPYCKKWYKTITNTHLLHKHGVVKNIPKRNHKVKEVTFFGYEDTYNINVEGIHNFATEAGVIIKNSWYHKDPTMLEYLRNPTTADMHLDFTRLLFKMPESEYDYHKEHSGDKTLRKGTKNGFTFPQFYGDYYGNNAVSLWTWMQLTGKKIKPGQGLEISAGMTIGDWLRKHGITTYKQFEKHVQRVEQDMWDNRFPVYKQWRENQYQWYLRHGYLTSLSGFTFQTIMSKNDTANYPIQGVCFHCLLWGIIRLLKLIKKKKMKTKLIFQVHDSIMADTPKEERDDFLELSKQVLCHDLKRYWDFIITPLELEADCSALNGNWHKMETIMHYIH